MKGKGKEKIGTYQDDSTAMPVAPFKSSAGGMHGHTGTSSNSGQHDHKYKYVYNSKDGVGGSNDNLWTSNIDK